MDITNIKDWLGAIALVISFSGMIYAFITSRSKDNSSRLNLVENKQDEHADRILKIENDLEHMPKINDFHGIKLQMEMMAGDLGKMNENLKAVNKTVNRMEDYLLKDKL